MKDIRNDKNHEIFVIISRCILLLLQWIEDEVDKETKGLFLIEAG